MGSGQGQPWPFERADRERAGGKSQQLVGGRASPVLGSSSHLSGRPVDSWWAHLQTPRVGVGEGKPPRTQGAACQGEERWLSSCKTYTCCRMDRSSSHFYREEKYPSWATANLYLRTKNKQTQSFSLFDRPDKGHHPYPIKHPLALRPPGRSGSVFISYWPGQYQ